MDHPRFTGRADLHIHPNGNWGDDDTPVAIYKALRASGLDVAVLTEHDRIDVAQDLVARSRDEGCPVELVVGEEITTRQGHLLGIGLSERVPAGRSLAESIAMIHDQDGIAVVAHPLLRPTWRRPSTCSSSWPEVTNARVPMRSRGCIPPRPGSRAGGEACGG